MINKIIRIINLIYKRFYLKKINFRDKVLNLELIKSFNEIDHNILLKIPKEKCITSIFWYFDETNPFVKTIQNNDIKYLEYYYNNNIPLNINQLFEIDFKSDFGKLSPLYYVLPWTNKSPKEIFNQRKRIILNENKKYGFNVNLKDGGYTDFGPVNNIKINIEFKRIIEITKSIKNKGYIEQDGKDGCINGYFIIKDNDWMFYITSGKHRAYALAALGHEYIPVVTNSDLTIDYSEYLNWKNFKNKIFTKGEIDKIFNKIFNKKL